jgi:repressor LexA
MESSVKDLITKKGVSVKAFARQAGIPYTTLLAMIQAGIDKSSVGNVIKVAKALGVDVETLSQKVPGHNMAAMPTSVYPVVPAGIAAGSLEEIDCMMDLPQASVPDMLMGRWAGDKRVMLMHVNGDSMDNVVPDKSIIAVLTGVEREQLRNGDIVVASDGDRTYTIKRFYNDTENRRIILRPDSKNPAFLPIVFSYDQADDLKIIGKVVIYSVFL